MTTSAEKGNEMSSKKEKTGWEYFCELTNRDCKQLSFDPKRFSYNTLFCNVENLLGLIQFKGRVGTLCAIKDSTLALDTGPCYLWTKKHKSFTSFVIKNDVKEIFLPCPMNSVQGDRRSDKIPTLIRLMFELIFKHSLYKYFFTSPLPFVFRSSSFRNTEDENGWTVRSYYNPECETKRLVSFYLSTISCVAVSTEYAQYTYCLLKFVRQFAENWDYWKDRERPQNLALEKMLTNVSTGKHTTDKEIIAALNYAMLSIMGCDAYHSCPWPLSLVEADPIRKNNPDKITFDQMVYSACSLGGGRTPRADTSMQRNAEVLKQFF